MLYKNCIFMFWTNKGIVIIIIIIICLPSSVTTKSPGTVIAEVETSSMFSSTLRTVTSHSCAGKYYLLVGSCSSSSYCLTGTLLLHRHAVASPARCCLTGTLLPHRHAVASPARCCLTGTLLPHRHAVASPARCCRSRHQLPLRQLIFAHAAKSCMKTKVKMTFTRSSS